MRRTKEDAEKTRQQILGAAQRVFERQGVARTSMEQIASDAGVTRGAVYWHFANKAELYFAMRETVSLPMIDRVDIALSRDAGTDALGTVEAMLMEVVTTLESDPPTRQVLGILHYKCEYVGEFAAELATQRLHTAEFIAKLARAYRKARTSKILRTGLEPELAARETCAFLIGLIRMWLMDQDSTLVRGRTLQLVRAHVAARRATPRSH
jgi:TetR/AcrR family transcriptional regulator, acrAB operon repressor